MLVLYPVFALLSLLPNVTAIAKLVPAAVAAVMVLCSIIVVKSTMDGQRWRAWPDVAPGSLHKPWPASPLDLGVVVATHFGAFGVNGSVPAILCEMKDPKQFPFAFKSAMLFIGAIYVAVMGCGYYGYGEFMQSDIVSSLSSFPASEAQAFGTPFAEWTGVRAVVLEDIMSLLLLVKLTIGFPLNLIAVFYSLQTFKYTRDYVPAGSVANKAMRLALAALIILIARLVPDFGKLFALVASVFGPLLQCVLPVVFGHKVRSDMGAGGYSLLRQLMHTFMLVVALFTMTVGFYQALQDVVS